MRKNKRVSALRMCVVLLLFLQALDCVFFAFAESAESEEQKIYCNATMDDAFADNYVMVVLNNEASLKYLQTETIDFSEINTASLESFTTPKGNKIKAMVDERKGAWDDEKEVESDSLYCVGGGGFGR